MLSFKEDPVSGCWLWTGRIESNGYGKVDVKRKACYAHRVSWELKNGPIPEGFYVCHRCDVKHCVNPAHLFLGTQRENIEDASRKGLMKNWRIQGDIVAEVLRLRNEGLSFRQIEKRVGCSRETARVICLG